jgi:phage-related baseplate assembly protein
MDTLRYAVRDYLDIYGEKRGCVRIPAAAAEATVRIYFSAGEAGTIPAGEAMTHDGETIYKLKNDVAYTGMAQSVTAEIECTLTGSKGNGLIAGDPLEFLATRENVTGITCLVSATGGQEKEDDETYRERIRTYGLTRLTTGPEDQYEAMAKEVTSEIIDANAVNGGAGVVNVYLLLKSDTGAAAIIDAVEEKLNARDARPLTDTVNVSRATAVPYKMIAAVTGGDAEKMQSAIEEYVQWQDESIGRAFNPDKLMALLYQAGAERVSWGAGSHFNGGAVAYTEIDPNQYCDGEIVLSM